ncbi:MAG: zf-HC2 domain-containing protein [Armatimonadota bacterium]
MKVCVEWWTALSAYVDDSLPPDEREKLEAHLEGCTSCRTALLELRALRQSVALLPRYEPPPMLKARILSATVDQPTWSERLAMEWRRWVWRLSLAGAAAVLVLFAWRFVPRQIPSTMGQIPQTMGMFMPGGTKQQSASRPPQQAKELALPSTPRTTAEPNQPVRMAKSSVRSSSSSVRVSSSPKPKVRWSAETRAPVTPEPAPADALQGEPIIQEDVPHIDVNSPPAGEQVATQQEEAESTTVATRFALPAEVLSQTTSGLDALREQIRVRNREQWNGQIRRNIQRKQVELDVITVRF